MKNGFSTQRLFGGLFFLSAMLIGCTDSSSVDSLFSPPPTDTVIVEVPVDLQLTITTPSANGKKVGYQVYMAGGCTLPGGTIEFRNGASGFSVCQSNNTWEATVDVSGAAVGNITVEAYLVNDDEESGAAVRVFDKTSSDCDSSAGRAATYAAGDGIGTPYSICTSAQFNNIRLNPTRSFVLRNDIDLQNVPFSPIPNTFSGVLDGDEFILRRLYIYDLSGNDIGIFKGIRNGAIVRDLDIESANVTGPAVVGIIAGRIIGTGATIENVSVTGQVAASTSWVGGLVGHVEAPATLTVNDAQVTLSSMSGQNYGGGILGGTATTAGAISITDTTVGGSMNLSGSYLGGIIGYMQGPELTLNDVHSTANLTINSGAADNYIGGIVGATTNAPGTLINIENCSSTGSITASSSWVGGIAGRFTGAKVWNCTASGAISVNTDIRAASGIGGLIGWTTDNLTDIYQSSAVVNISVTGLLVGNYYGGLVGTFIGTRIQESHATGVDTTTPGTITINTGDDATTGSAQIGGAFGRIYTNRGRTTTITDSDANVTILHDDYSTNNYVGGYVGSMTAPNTAAGAPAIVEVTDSSATGDVTSINRYIGGWAGHIYVPWGASYVRLTNVAATGDVTVTTRNNITPHYIGGLVGFAESRDAGDAEPSPIGHEWANVSTTGSVSVDSGAIGGNYVGGLVGYFHTGRSSLGGGNSFIRRGYATGNVTALSTGTNFNYVGGLIGRVYSATTSTTTIDSTGGQSYATGNVTADGTVVGGLFGQVDTGTSATITLTDLYSNGNVTGRRYVGGAIGYVSNGTTATMNFSDIQSHDANAATPANTVTATQLDSAGGLIGYATSTATTFLLSDCSSIAAVTSTTGYAGGLIGQDRDNIDISDCSASGAVTSSYPYVGGLTGGSDRSGRDFTDVTSSGLVTATVSGAANNLYVGGLSGYMRGTITRGRSTSDVNINFAVGATLNQALVGGLVGQGNNLTVDQSYALGAIDYSDVGVGNMSFTGGLLGWMNGAVTSSFALGNVEGGSQTGGLIGFSSSTVSKSFAGGDVSGTRYVGGLIGNLTANTAGAIDTTYALGSVTRNFGAFTDYFGQIIGFCNGGIGDAKVTNSYYNTTTSTLIAPIVGQATCNSSVAARALAPADMLAPGTGFAGWDFVGTDPDDWRYPTSFTRKGTASIYQFPIPYWAMP